MDEMNAETFNRLVRKMQRGDRRAWEKLYEYFTPKIVNEIAYRNNGDCGLDIAHDFFSHGIYTIKEYVESPITYVLRSCDNTYKNRKSKTAREEPTLPEEIDESEHAATFDRYKLDCRVFGSMTRFVNKLTPRERELVYLRFVQKYSLLEISAQMGESYANIRQICSRTCKKLKKLVTKCREKES